MNNDLISRKAFFGEIQEYVLPITENNLMGAADVYYRTVHLLEEAPAVDAVEVDHAKWEERIVNIETQTTDLFCSKCDFASHHWRYKYCPNCGRKMGLEE